MASRAGEVPEGGAAAGGEEVNNALSGLPFELRLIISVSPLPTGNGVCALSPIAIAYDDDRR